MTKAQQHISLFLILSSLYLSAFLGLIPLPEGVQWHIPFIPFYAVFGFGFYLLTALAYGVLTFNEKEKEYIQLKGEIDEARSELRKMGVDVD